MWALVGGNDNGNGVHGRMPLLDSEIISTKTAYVDSAVLFLEAPCSWLNHPLTRPFNFSSVACCHSKKGARPQDNAKRRSRKAGESPSFCNNATNSVRSA